MHECPFCGYVCDCDMDDTWDLPLPDNCPHVCPDDDVENDWEDYEEFMDGEEMNMNKIVTLKINNGRDRADLVSILAEAGYIVEIEVVKEDFPINETYFVNIYEKKESEK